MANEHADMLKALKASPPRQRLSLLEFATAFQAMLKQVPNTTMEDVAERLRLDIRFVRRVLAIAARAETDYQRNS